MLALAGRETTVYTGGDVVPVCILVTVDVCCRMLALLIPIQRCSWFMADESEGGALVLSWKFVLLALVCAAVMTILEEMLTMWNPFGRAMNTFPWSLGIASEIDNMLNEFYEYDRGVMVRKHGYMQSSRERNEMMGRHSESDFYGGPEQRASI